MPLMTVVPDLIGHLIRVPVMFDEYGESQPILVYYEKSERVGRCWVRRTTFVPAMMKEPVYHFVSESGYPMSAALPEVGMQALLDASAERLESFATESHFWGY